MLLKMLYRWPHFTCILVIITNSIKGIKPKFCFEHYQTNPYMLTAYSYASTFHIAKQVKQEKTICQPFGERIVRFADSELRGCLLSRQRPQDQV
jgi:hypothetical protein